MKFNTAQSIENIYRDGNYFLTGGLNDRGVIMYSMIDKRRSKEVNISKTNTYTEVEIPQNSSYSLFLYLIDRSQTSMFVAICFEHTIDEVLNNYDEDTIIDTWPTLARLLYNGLNDKYKEGALIKLEDLDDGESKWFVASISGNHNLNDMDDVLNERTQETVELVIECSKQLVEELQDKQPSVLRAMGRGTAAIAIGVLAAFLGS